MGHIQILFYTFIFNFCPELIEQGFIYATIPPLFKATIGKEYKYLQDEAALEKFKAEHVGKKYIIGRMKGYELVWPLSTLPLIRGVA